VPALGRRVCWLLRLCVSAAVVAYLAAQVDLTGVVGVLARVRLSLVVAGLLLYVLGQVLSGCKWSLIGTSLGLVQPLHRYVRFYFVGMFCNLFAPSTLGGDVVRGLLLGGRQHTGRALSSVLFDRMSGLAMLMALGAAAVLLFPGYDVPRPLVALTVGVGSALVLGWWMCPRLVRVLPPGTRLRRQVEDDLAPLWRDRRLLAAVALTSLAFHLSQVVVQWVLARAAGVTVPLSYCLVFHPLVALLAALPISVSGLGVREGGYLYFLTRIGIAESVAIGVGLLWLAVSVLAGLGGGAVLLASGAQLPTSVRSSRPPAESPPA